jgi:hypothetical protein
VLCCGGRVVCRRGHNRHRLGAIRYARAVRAVFAILLVLAGCGDNVRGNITINVAGPWAPAFDDFVAFSGYAGMKLGTGGDFHIEVIEDTALPVEGYRIDVVPGADMGSDAPLGAWTVSARDVLGAQYGVAAALENLGFRFRHPAATFAPGRLADRNEGIGVVHQPEVRVRGLQLHTLHPIEGYFAFWEPDPVNTRDAHRIIDWLIKNRGNYIQWVPLDNIITDPAQHAAWKPFTQELIEYAHSRGVRVGINIQLFGNSNLQLAFDLVDKDDVPLADSIAQRLPLITDELPFDAYDISFGEFFGAEPEKFIESINEVARQFRTLAPQAEVHGFVHVGALERVTYMGEDLLYYFLLKHADPSIIPDIHTVMYYNLYDDAGGAYHHDDFAEHRQYLVDRMCANQPAGYVPESGYWVAFDNSLPTYNPLYVYSRWRDLDGLAKEGCGPLDSHILFTTGWEWGYWLNDVATLRASYELTASPYELIEHAYAPDLGSEAARLIEAAMTEQKAALMDQRLAGYVASRDVSIDVGYKFDPPIVSQPKRIGFDEVIAPGFDVDTFTANVLVPLEQYAQRLDELDAKLDALSLPESRWTRELRDGFEINRLRTRYIHALYTTIVAHARGASTAEAYARAEDLYNRARPIVKGRHADLHDTHDRRLLDRTPNHGLYQYGYLYNADTMCFWRREMIEVGTVLGVTTDAPPGCLL